MKKLTLIASILLWTSAIFAQGQPVNKPWHESIEVHGMLRIRPEIKVALNFQKKDSNDIKNNADFIGQKAWITAIKKFGDNSNVLITIQDSRIWGGQTNSITGLDTAATAYSSGNDTSSANPYYSEEKYQEKAADIREAYLNLGIGRLFVIQIGRQKLIYGDQRLVGHLDWTNVGRSFDAIRIKHDTKTNSLHIWSSIMQEGNAGDVMNVAIDDKDDYLFNGLYNTFKGFGFMNIDAYYISKLNIDDSYTLKLHTFGARLTNRIEKNGKTSKGVPYDWTLEGAYQTGKKGRNSNNKQQVIAAYAGAVAIGFTINPGFKIRFGIEGDVASGDDKPTSGAIRTFDNLVHTNHLHYGQADMISWRNMVAGSGNCTVLISKDFSARVAYWYAGKMKSEDDWYGVSGPVSGANGRLKIRARNLFNEIDVTIKYKARSYLSLAAGYSYVIRGKAVDKASGANSDYQYSYISTMAKF